MNSDISIRHIEAEFITVPRRVSFVFAKGTMTENLICNVSAVVVNRAGNEATGAGSIHLAAPWAFPSKAVPVEAKRQAMKTAVLALAEAIAGVDDYAHPLDHYWNRQRDIIKVARTVSEGLALAEPLPSLAAYVCYAPIDMALLDAFGRANDINTYAGLTAERCAHDLSHYLGPRFQGRYLSHYLSETPDRYVPFAHTVGERDPLTQADCGADATGDGLPTTLEDWIRRDRPRFLKVKLACSSMEAALDRTMDVFRLADDMTLHRMRITADFNEACEHVQWLVEYLRKLRERSQAAFEALAYVEQPFRRDADVSATEVAAVQELRPLVADEAITDTESLEHLIQAGWAGIALKVGKVMSAGLLHVPATVDAGRFLTVQDLCNSGLAHLASIGLASRIPLVGGVECNGRQFVPQAFPQVRTRRPKAFASAHGVCDATEMAGVGLGF